jgi:hypothetical protein
MLHASPYTLEGTKGIRINTISNLHLGNQNVQGVNNYTLVGKLNHTIQEIFNYGQSWWLTDRSLRPAWAKRVRSYLNYNLKLKGLWGHGSSGRALA